MTGLFRYDDTNRQAEYPCEITNRKPRRGIPHPRRRPELTAKNSSTLDIKRLEGKPIGNAH